VESPDRPRGETLPWVPTGFRGSIPAYAIGVAITGLAILSQYFVPQSIPAALPLYQNFFGDLAVVYGIPILALALLIGKRPLAHYADRMGTAAAYGISWYAAMSLLAVVVTGILEAIYLAYDPSALQLLSRQSPVVQAARSDPWFWVGFSFVIGFVEETIFRGWIFGYWLTRGTVSWFGPAIATSVFFAGVHLYYGTTYGPASPLIFPTLFLEGFAFAAAMKDSGGNVVVIAILHGAHDAIAFYALISMPDSDFLLLSMILAGTLVGLVLLLRYLQRTDTTPRPPLGSPYSGDRAPSGNRDERTAWGPPPPPMFPPGGQL
jgi:membrane protease YdiL (CAAX protease family)